MRITVDKKLIEILACPKCKGDVALRGMFFSCAKCKLAYPILDGDVPDMLIDDAWKLKDAQKAKFRHKLKL